MGVPVVWEFFLTGTIQINDFLLPIGGCAFIGVSLVLANKQSEIIQIGTADAFLLTSLTWILIPVFAGLPFYCCIPLNLSFVDSWFEAVSALTATGSTVISDLSIMPRWIMIWRFLLCYIGGAGMILMGMVIFPILRIGGMQLFRTESSEKNEKIMPSVSQMASWIVSIYSGAIILCFVLLKLTGLSSLDALCHAVSAISTCGFSTYTNSVTALNNIWSEIILFIGMVFGGSSLLLYIKIIKGKFSLFRKDSQLKGYLKTLLVFSILTTLLRWYYSDLSFIKSLKEGIFNSVSIITTTGFFNSDYEKWGVFSMVLFPLMSLIGGCTGSTSGGIKIFRFQILFTCIKTHILQLRRPHGVFMSMYSGQKVTESVAMSVFVFMMLYMLTIFCAAFLLSLCHLDFVTSFSASIAAIGNVGLGIGYLVGPLGSMVNLMTTPKIIIIVCMILGRLELLTLLTLLMPSFWKK